MDSCGGNQKVDNDVETGRLSFAVEGLVEGKKERSTLSSGKGLLSAVDDTAISCLMHRSELPMNDDETFVPRTGKKSECVPLGMELRVRFEEDTISSVDTKVEIESKVNDIDINKGRWEKVPTANDVILKSVTEPTSSHLADDVNNGNEVMENGIFNGTSVLAEEDLDDLSHKLSESSETGNVKKDREFDGKHAGAKGCQIRTSMIEENVEMSLDERVAAVLTEATVSEHKYPVDGAAEVRYGEEPSDAIDRKRSATCADLEEAGAGRLEKIVKLQGVDEVSFDLAENVTSNDHHNPTTEAKDEGSNDCHTQRITEEVKLKTSVCQQGDTVVVPRTPRYKKRKVALFVAYCGVGYQGMQRNPGAVTIEGDLEQALFKAGAIAESNFGDPRKVEWMRAARTDKGVSAVGQVVSGRFFIDPPGFVERVNSHLPRQIHVLGYKRVTNTFNSKNLCDRRRYEYILPVFAFDPTAHLDRERMMQLEGERKISLCSEKRHEIEGVATNGDVKRVSENMPEPSQSILNDVSRKETIGEDLGQSLQCKIVEGPSDETVSKICEENSGKSRNNAMEIRDHTVCVIGENNANVIQSCTVSYVEENNAQQDVESSPQQNDGGNRSMDAVSEPVIVSKEHLKSFQFGKVHFSCFNSILGQYVGTHNFHNFTSRISADDPSARRYIVSFEATDVFKIGNMEFVKCKVVGQSFMLHQIRKMIGLAVAIMRGCAPSSMLETALRRDVKVNVPMAPELGLFLDECIYTSYNQKFAATHEAVSLDDFRTEVEDFKWEQIYSHIASTEAREGVVALWLHSLNDRNYPDFVEERKKAQ